MPHKVKSLKKTDSFARGSKLVIILLHYYLQWLQRKASVHKRSKHGRKCFNSRRCFFFHFPVKSGDKYFCRKIGKFRLWFFIILIMFSALNETKTVIQKLEKKQKKKYFLRCFLGQQTITSKMAQLLSWPHHSVINDKSFFLILADTSLIFLLEIKFT